MNLLIEQRCKGIFRSYKIFRASGEVVQHTTQEFQEWNFNDNHVLTISLYRHPRHNVQVETDQWHITFRNKRYFIEIVQPKRELEIISINHTGMVIEDSTRSEKVFFAPIPTWEDLVQNRLPVL